MKTLENILHHSDVVASGRERERSTTSHAQVRCLIHVIRERAARARMVDESLVSALLRTVFSIPQKEWTESDLDVIKKHLESAMQFKGLTGVSEVLVKDLLETLEMLKNWKGPEPCEYIEMIEKMFKERQSTGVQVSVPMPTVSSMRVWVCVTVD